MTAARLVSVKGLSSSTSRLNHVGQGSERRRDAPRQTTATRTTTPSSPRRIYASVAIWLSRSADARNPDCGSFIRRLGLARGNLPLPPDRDHRLVGALPVDVPELLEVRA